MTQKPHGPADLYCPMWRKAMSKVCHTCPLWCQVRGMNPNTGAEVDRWDCAFAWGPTLQIETSQQARQAGAAVESARNEAVKSAEKIEAAVSKAAVTIARAAHEAVVGSAALSLEMQRVIEGDHGQTYKAITSQS